MRYESFIETLTGGKLHLFSVYTDFGAYRRIKWMVNAIAKLTGQRRQCSSEMWKLDSLTANISMKKMLADDAANSDVLIAVVGSLEQQRPELMEWLESLTPLEPHRSGLLIGLLGDEENRTKELDWTAKQLIRCSQKINRKFLWHWMGHHDLDTPDWLAESVETLLADKQSVFAPPVLQEAVAGIA